MTLRLSHRRPVLRRKQEQGPHIAALRKTDDKSKREQDRLHEVALSKETNSHISASQIAFLLRSKPTIPASLTIDRPSALTFVSTKRTIFSLSGIDGCSVEPQTGSRLLPDRSPGPPEPPAPKKENPMKNLAAKVLLTAGLVTLVGGLTLGRRRSLYLMYVRQPRRLA
jgi:hypothetical protein